MYSINSPKLYQIGRALSRLGENAIVDKKGPLSLILPLTLERPSKHKPSLKQPKNVLYSVVKSQRSFKDAFAGYAIRHMLYIVQEAKDIKPY